MTHLGLTFPSAARFAATLRFAARDAAVGTPLAATPHTVGAAAS